MPNISMNKNAHKFAPVMLDVPRDCAAIGFQVASSLSSLPLRYML
jgi:hypothetical protein